MVKLLNATVSDETHDLLHKIKKLKDFANNSEAFEWVIKVAAEIAEKEASNNA